MKPILEKAVRFLYAVLSPVYCDNAFSEEGMDIWVCIRRQSDHEKTGKGTDPVFSRQPIGAAGAVRAP